MYLTISNTAFFWRLILGILHIDSHVKSQMLIGVVTLDIGFAGIKVSFALVIKVILSFIVGH